MDIWTDLIFDKTSISFLLHPYTPENKLESFDTLDASKILIK